MKSTTNLYTRPLAGGERNSKAMALLSLKFRPCHSLEEREGVLIDDGTKASDFFEFESRTSIKSEVI